MRTNSPTDSAIALTWGVFPGREIVQPTILDPSSFLAWKDEAFGLWNTWSDLYTTEKESRDLLRSIADGWWLVCVVDNDFRGDAGGGRFWKVMEGLKGF